VKSSLDAYRFPKTVATFGRYALIIWKKRETRKIPGGSSGAQAARNTGLVIRIVSARRREKLVMAGLLAEKAAGIKRLSCDSATS
jgi:hypothetical protein